MKQVLLSVILLLSIKSHSQGFDSKLVDQLDLKVEEYIEGVVPGMAVGIVKDGKIVYQKYLGYANLEHEIKIDENARFNIASNAKQYTALCILKLVESGKVNLEDDFRKYLPNVYKNIPEKITISNLLTHSSGIRDYCDLLALTGKTWWRQFIDNDDVVELLKVQKELNFSPGSEHLYSNSNYILLTEIVKKVSNQTFSEFAKNLFEELEMPNTAFRTHYGEIIPHKTKPYGNWGAWREEASITEVHGDGALYTNLKDQLRWEQIIQTNNEQYLSKKLVDKSQSPLVGSIEDGHGFGLEFNNDKGLNYTFHNGRTGAYNATFLRFPTQKVSVVVMSNNRNVPPDYIAWQLSELILNLEEGKNKKGYPSNPEQIEKFKSIQNLLGNYKNDDGTVIRITAKNDTLYREIYQHDPQKLINEEGALFEYENIQGLKMNFTNIGQQNQQFTIYKSTQEPTTYYKQANINTDKSELNGRFYNDETDTEILLKHVEGNSYALTKNGRERHAQLVLKDYLRMMNSYMIKVQRNQKGAIIGLMVDYNRIRNVRFNKQNP